MAKVEYIDPPSGWKYGFPKVLPEGTAKLTFCALCWVAWK